ncbi:hypothetical protein F4680DRAFT_45174 [Xylaria scruposa]|nr:hypothetical protein F4680DRAFT_45174 [Xylaria scruposa]
MATWGGSSRDGRLAPNNNLACNNNNGSNNHNHSNSYSTNFTSLAYANNTTPNPSAYVNADADTVATGPDTLDHYLFRGLEAPNVPPDISIANDTVSTASTTSSRYADSPLPSPSDNDSLFATVGDTLSNPFHTTPNATNFPLLHVSGALNSAFCTASRELPRPIPYPLSLAIPSTPTPISTQTQTQLQPQTQFQTLTSALAYQPHYPNFGFPEQLNIPSNNYSGGYYRHTPLQNYQFGSPPAVQGSQGSQNFCPYFNTTPTILPQPPMSNTNFWSNPSLSQAQQPPTSTGVVSSTDDHYLVTLATQDFSSPSLPPLSHPTSPTTLSLSPRRQSKLLAAGQEMPPSTRRRTANRGGAVDLTKEEPDLNSGIDSSIPLVTMPAATRRRSLASADPSTRKRRPSAATSPSSRPNKARRKEPPINSDNCPFSDDVFDGLDGSETIDLSNATEVPVELMAPKVDNRVKIGNFQCVICMDDTTALTVTHCGHLFCSECLHSSLHIDSMKRTCPVCRAKVELKDKNRKAAKSFFHLELKVMTATKKGKRPVGT